MKTKSIITALAMFVILVGLFGIYQPVAAEGQNGTMLTAAVVEATPYYKLIYKWDLDKSVQPEIWNLFAGDSGTSLYTVTATKDAGSVLGFIDGQVCVTNGGVENTQGLNIAVHVMLPPSTEDVALSTIVFQSGELAAGATQCYHVMAYVDPLLLAGKTFKLTADVAITNHSGHLDTPWGPSPSLTNTFPLNPNYILNNTLNVSDTNGASWTFSDDSSVTYSKTFTCDSDEGKHVNTVSATQNDGNNPQKLSDSASVQVNCYDLEVTKDASTSFQRKYNWNIAKTGSESSLTLALGQQFQVYYSVTTGLNSVTPFTDSDWKVAGAIAVKNPAPIAATLNSVSDVVSPAIAASVDCGVSFPYSLPAGGTLYCTYSAALPDAAARTNTATAVLQNYSYDEEGYGTSSGTTGFSGTAAVSFEQTAMSEVDECVTVTDTLAGTLGTVCKGDAPKTFSYSYYVGPYDVCGPYSVKNVATFATNDTATTGTAEWTVDINVPCASGCSLTPGYWKTHSSYGPAPYDSTWASIGENTAFYLSGNRWYDVLWTAPKGNAYYILAHAFIAARLNQYNGADVSVISAQLVAAENFFQTYTPTATLSKAQRAEVLAWATAIDNYNNGLIGPGHCSE